MSSNIGRSDRRTILSVPAGSSQSCKSVRCYFRTLTFSFLRGIVCSSSGRRNNNCSNNWGKSTGGGENKGRNSHRSSCSIQGASQNRCCRFEQDEFVECEFELNPCFDHFESELFHTRLLASASPNDDQLLPFRKAYKLKISAIRDVLDMPSAYDCPVCFCEYTMDGKQTPYVLPCGHSVCYECSYKLSNNLPAKDSKCPFCRRSLPSQKSAFSVNYALLAVLDQFKMENKQSQFKEMEGSNQALPVAEKKENEHVGNFPRSSSCVKSLRFTAESNATSRIESEPMTSAKKSLETLVDYRRASHIWKEPILPRFEDPRVTGRKSRLNEPIRMSNGNFSPISKSASSLMTQQSSKCFVKSKPPVIPPHVPLHYDFIKAGEVIPENRRPPGNNQRNIIYLPGTTPDCETNSETPN